jgi:hypothetical protein
LESLTDKALYVVVHPMISSTPDLIYMGINMCDTVFAFGERGGFHFECPSKWRK